MERPKSFRFHKFLHLCFKDEELHKGVSKLINYCFCFGNINHLK